MKIGIITSPFGPLPPNALGAVEIIWYYMGNAIARKGHRVEFYSKADKGYIKDINVHINQISGYKRTKHIWGDIIKDFAFTVKALIRLKRCDILVQNTFWSPILSPLFFWKYKKTVYNVARMPKGQFRLYGAVHQFSCVSQAVRNEMESYVGNDKRVVVVSNPVNVHYYDYKERINNDGVFTIGYHGRINQEKGLDILCKAAHILYDKHKIRLIIIGPHEIRRGGSGEKYVAWLKSLCPEVETVFTGAISNPERLNELLGGCDIYCYPSMADKGETFGVSPLEAMCTGCPVVVSSLACFKDFITDGETGLVFDHHAENAVALLADKIEMLINSAELRNKIGRAAYIKAQDFSVEKIADKYIANFEKLLNNE